jgi:NAD-dependent DNA ligase
VVTKKEANPNGPLFEDEEIFAITGNFSLTQSEIIEIGCKLGLTYNKGVIKKTTLLIVGAHDLKKLAGKDKSRKQITAENINLKGGDIKIIDENDIFEMQKTYLK